MLKDLNHQTEVVNGNDHRKPSLNTGFIPMLLDIRIY